MSNELGVVTESLPDTVRGADVAYFSYRRMPKARTPAGFSDIPPELVVEVLGKSKTWAALVQKAGEYLRMGVDRVWLVNPRTQRVHVYRADDEPVIKTVGQRLTDPQVLPGFSCAVREFFEN